MTEGHWLDRENGSSGAGDRQGVGPEEGVASVNGLLMPLAQARFSVLDRGFLIGDAVFETLVAFEAKIIDLTRHLQRLRTSAATLDIPIPWSDAELGFELEGLVSQVALPKKQIRLMITRGDGIGVAPPPDPHPNRVALCMAVPPPKLTPKVPPDGVSLKRMIKTDITRGPLPKIPFYGPAIMALSRAEREGYHDILWTHPEGDLTEAHAANIFLIARHGDQVEIVTPPAHSGILLGVTRHRVIDLLRDASIPVMEQVVYQDEIPRFDEAFLTSSVRGLVAVGRIDQHRLHTRRPHSVFRHVERLFNTWVATEVGHGVEWETGRTLS